MNECENLPTLKMENLYYNINIQYESKKDNTQKIYEINKR
jgi:hypothetical protein